MYDPFLKKKQVYLEMVIQAERAASHEVRVPWAPTVISE